MRWRVISTMPNSLICETVVLARSFWKCLRSRSSISRRCLTDRMSMRSFTITPPRSRRRSCRAISSTASWLVWNAFVSLSRALRERPEFTSMATSASAWSITSAPPEGSGTSRAWIRSTCRSTSNAWKIGMRRSQNRTLVAVRGLTTSRNAFARWNALSLSHTMPSTVTSIESRMVRRRMSPSAYSWQGAPTACMRLSITCHRRVRYCASRASSVRVASKPAVRRMKPKPSGRLSESRIFRILRRPSSSSTLRETPTLSMSGIITSRRPGIDR